MMGCWISDTAYPVVTEINLDAVDENRNQFNHEIVNQDEEGWVHYPNPEGGFLQYKILSQEQGKFRILFYSNGGGTLTTAVEIKCMVSAREILVNGVMKRVRILRLLEYKFLP
jgi:hypothetical protein